MSTGKKRWGSNLIFYSAGEGGRKGMLHQRARDY